MRLTYPKLRTILIWGVVVIVTLVLLAVGWLFILAPSQARQEWETARAALEAKGEKLALADFPKPNIPDEDNFFADPIWWELSDRVLVKTGYGELHRPRLAADKRQLWVFHNQMEQSEVERLQKDFPEFARSINRSSRYQVAKRVLAEASKNPALTKRAAEPVLRIQAPGEPMISRIRELSLRKDAYFPLEYGDGWQMAFDHANALIAASQWLDSRTNALLELGRYREAFQDIILLIRLGETLRRDLLVYSQHLQISIMGNAADRIDQGIRLHAWTAEELLAFQPLLEAVDAPAGLASTFRTERAFLISNVWPSLSDEQFAAVLPESPSTTADIKAISWIYRTLWKPGDMVFFADLVQQELEVLDRWKSTGMNAKLFPDRFGTHFILHDGLFERYAKSISSISFPSLSSARIKTALVQTGVHLTRVAIALELYRMEHGEYPESLDAVASYFPKGMPLDIATMSPLHYKRNADGTFALWSVGWDGKDENGKTEKRLGAGDWVWGN